MELLYLYIKEYKVLNEQEINFYNLNIKKKSEYEFEIISSINDVIEKLKDKKNFFRDKNNSVKNITALIGENGTGKSTIIEYLSKFFIENESIDDLINNCTYLIIFFEEGHIYYRSSEEISLESKNIKKNEYNCKKVNSIYYTTGYENVESDINISDLVFFEDEFNKNKYSDVDIFELEKLDRKKINSIFDNFLINNYTCLIDFLANHKHDLDDFSKKENLDIKLPKKIILKNHYIRIKKNDDYIESMMKKIFRESLKELNLYYIIKYSLDYFITNISKNYLIENPDKIYPDFFINSSLSLKEFFLKFMEYYVDNSEKLLREESKYLNPREKNIIIYETMELKEELKFFVDYCDKNKIKFDNYEFQIELDIEKKSKIAQNILKKMKKLISQGIFINAKFEKKLSKGEENILFFLAKLDYKLENYRRKKDNLKKENFIFFIDEGEVSLHPKWQRKYINFLIKISEIVFKKNESVEYILSSHSPFIVSDLPKENIVFLDKEENSINKNRLKESEFKTFGANIHTLLSHGFFMDATMGEFAKQKLIDIVDFFTGERCDFEFSRGEIKKIIEMIGEPIISNKLNELYLKYYSSELKNETSNILIKKIEDINDRYELLKIQKIIERKLKNDKN